MSAGRIAPNSAIVVSEVLAVLASLPMSARTLLEVTVAATIAFTASTIACTSVRVAGEAKLPELASM